VSQLSLAAPVIESLAPQGMKLPRSNLAIGLNSTGANQTVDTKGGTVTLAVNKREFNIAAKAAAKPSPKTPASNQNSRLSNRARHGLGRAYTAALRAPIVNAVPRMTPSRSNIASLRMAHARFSLNPQPEKPAAKKTPAANMEPPPPTVVSIPQHSALLQQARRRRHAMKMNGPC